MEIGKMNAEIQKLIEDAKNSENENKIEQAIQIYKEIIVKTSKLITLQPNMKTKYLNDIAIFSLKMLKIENKLLNDYSKNQGIESFSKKILNEVKILAENAKNNTNYQESYENFIKASNKLISLTEIDSNPKFIEIYREKAKEYRNEGIKLRKIYDLKKIDDDFEEDNRIELKEEMEVKEQLISNLMNKKSQISTENESLKSVITNQNSTISSLEDKMSNLENKIKLLEKENYIYKENEQKNFLQKNEFEELLNKKTKECESLKEKLLYPENKDFKNDNEKIKNENEMLKKENIELSRNYGTLLEKYTKLKKEIQDEKNKK